MKQTISLFVACLIFFTACNQSEDQSAQESHQTGDAQHATTDESKVETLHAVYTNLDDGVSTFFTQLTNHYLAIKNALVKSDEAGARDAAMIMSSTLKSFDKSLLTVGQKKIFDESESALRTGAEQVAQSKLEDQRKQFRGVSNAMYELAKNFQSGKTLYHEYCPMYEGGAMWLSDAKEIANPFYGDKMMKCGTVKEVIQ